MLLLRNGEVKIGHRVWEHPTFEETFESFWLWTDEYGMWEDCQVEGYITHWMPLPELPKGDE